MNNEIYIKIATYILSGAGVALALYVVTFLFSIPLGIFFAMGKVSGFKPVVFLLDIYTWVLRGTPLLLQLYFMYYTLPFYGIVMSEFTVVCVTFVINYAAYFTEIFRGGIQSVDKGQYEAAKALGMSYHHTMRRIVLPQTIKAVLPPMGNEAVTLIKDTALCSAIALPEIMKNTNAMVATYGEPKWFLLSAVIYLVITFVIIQLFKLIEKKFAYYR